MRPDRNKGLRPEGGSPPQVALHVALAVAGWILFIFFWRVVGERGLSPGAVLSLAAMATFLVVVIVSTTIWIMHNVRIARCNRRKGNRSVPELPYLKDKIGYSVESGSFEALKLAPFIEVTIEGEKKIYRTAGRASETGETVSG
jgi:hypothetical protein